MKAKATIIQGSVRAVATTTDGLMAVAYTQPNGIHSKAETTDETGVQRFLEVTPEEPQQLVWLVPQYGVDFFVTTSTGLEWKIE